MYKSYANKKTTLGLYDIYRNIVTGKKEEFYGITDYNCTKDCITVLFEGETTPTEYHIVESAHPDIVEANYMAIMKHLNKQIKLIKKGVLKHGAL